MAVKVGGKVGGKNFNDETEGQKVMNLMAKVPDITVNELSNQLGISTRKMSRIIKELRETGKITRIGSTRSGSWVVNK